MSGPLTMISVRLSSSTSGRSGPRASRYLDISSALRWVASAVTASIPLFLPVGAGTNGRGWRVERPRFSGRARTDHRRRDTFDTRRTRLLQCRGGGGQGGAGGDHVVHQPDRGAAERRAAPGEGGG